MEWEDTEMVEEEVRMKMRMLEEEEVLLRCAMERREETA